VFANAVTLASDFTRPVLISTRQQSGKIETGCGTYILVNSDGWILTAGHVVAALIKCNQDKPKYDQYLAARAAIESNTALSKGKRKQQLKVLRCDREWVTNVSYWWGRDDITAGTWHVDGAADLAAVHLLNHNWPNDQKFAKFGDPAVELPQGRSLCKLGFPFHEFKTDFDEVTGKFLIKELPPLVRYPLDGIVTRYNVIQNPGGSMRKFVEMSTPGLKGQSGGPLFDVEGKVWGVQSRTHSLALGFSPEVQTKSKKVAEHQFLNSGVAAYISEIARFLCQHGIAFDHV
jgi:Trypsin-like peptidase domain